MGRLTVKRLVAIAVVLSFYAGLTAVVVNDSFGERTDRVAGVDGARSSGEAGAAGSVSQTSRDGGEGSKAGATEGAATRPSDGGRLAGTAGSRVPGSSTSATGPASSTEGASAGADSIVIGVHDDNPGAAFGEFGVQGGPNSDQGQWIRAIVEWINANGGMGGRQVQLVHHVTESLNGSFDQQAERACAVFTEDNDAVAVVGGARVPTLNLVDCLARHDTPLVWSYHFMANRATFDQYANYLYMPAMVSSDRLGVWIDAVDDAGFFKGGTIGVVRYDNAIHEELARKVLEPALHRRGHEITEEVAFTGATGASSAADLSAQANNAIVRFRSRNVDRVIFEPTSAVLPLLFIAAAESQRYRPRYTMTSFDVPSFQAANASGFPQQLVGSLAFGWLPAGDVEWEQQPKPLAAPAQKCVEITQGADPPGNGSVRRFCDGLFFLKFLFDNGAEPTTAGIRRAVDAVGTSYPSAWTFSANLGSGRHDGATVGRVLAFDERCRCYVYVGGDTPIP